MTRLLVIGAHSADFVWRAGGAVAVTTAAGGEARQSSLGDRHPLRDEQLRAVGEPSQPSARQNRIDC